MALTDFLTSIADAIRYAESSVGTINAQDFADRIRALGGGEENVIDVGIGDDYTYHTIKSAELDIADGGTIRIHEGTYDEWGIGTSAKAINYVGVDKDTCIVENGLSDKMYSVFNLSGGNKTVKNLTIHQTHSDPQNPDTPSVAYKAYGVHCDSEGCEGHEYLIENCIIRNKYFSACGFGLWQDHKITVKDCTLDWYDNRGESSAFGTYYCHCNTFSTGVTGQELSLIGNTITADQSKALRIDIASQEGSEMICEFIDNTLSSDLYGTTSDAVAFGTNEHTTLTETSEGNNISTLNYNSGGNEVEPNRVLNATFKSGGGISASAYKTYEYVVSAGTYRFTVNATNTSGIRYGSQAAQAQIGDVIANIVTEAYKRNVGDTLDITLSDTVYLYAHITNTQTLESGYYLTLEKLS